MTSNNSTKVTGKDLKLIEAFKTEEQLKAYNLTHEYDVTFIMGNTGSGKTYVAVASAAQHLANKYDGKRVYKEIIILRPYLKSMMGALPGDVNDKLKYDMLPVLHNLKKIVSQADYVKYTDIKNPMISIYPSESARGMSFCNCIIIAEEFQNCDYNTLKTLLTRTGEDSKIIITGDLKQIDLKPAKLSGLKMMGDAFKEDPRVGYINLREVVRSPAAKAFSEIFDKYEKSLKEEN